jgi:multidrug efflux system outer membrane protein
LPAESLFVDVQDTAVGTPTERPVSRGQTRDRDRSSAVERPDIRQAEQQLVSANARIGEAKALLFPRISLTGSYGYTSTDLDTLFDGPSKAWNILGNLVQPIFNAGKNKRRVEITESRQRQTLYEYERTILNAFRETDDALVGYRTSGDISRAQAGRVEAERKVLELAELRYKGGVSDYLAVLDAQRSLFGAELDAAQSVGEHLVSLVQLYKALGGGWPAAPETGTGASN